MSFCLKYCTAVRSQTDVAFKIAPVHDTGWCAPFMHIWPLCIIGSGASVWLLLSSCLIQGLLTGAVTLERSKHSFMQCLPDLLQATHCALFKVLGWDSSMKDFRVRNERNTSGVKPHEGQSGTVTLIRAAGDHYTVYVIVWKNELNQMNCIFGHRFSAALSRVVKGQCICPVLCSGSHHFYFCHHSS